MGAPLKGKLFLLKVGDGSTPEVFTTVAGLRTTSLSINGEMIDVTDKDSGDQMRELLDGGGVKSMTVTGAGVFEDDASQTALEEKALSGEIANYQIAFESGRTYQGAFQVTNVEYTGEYNEAHTYSVTLESSGKITVTPGA